MKFPKIAIALFAVSGCLLEVVQGTDESHGFQATSGGSTGSGAAGGNTGSSTGAASNSATAAGGVGPTAAGGNGTTGGTTAGAVNGTSGGSSSGIGASSSGGSSTGGPPGCDAGLTYCVDVSTNGGISQGCTDTTTDPLNCGACDNSCATDYATGSNCSFGLCSCDEPTDELCAAMPATSPPSCSCIPVTMGCAKPSFARDVYPFLAQQKGTFGCAASGCHSGAMPASNLAFLDPAGHEDAGMAYVELTGTGSESNVDAGAFCDGGVPAGVPSECACVSRVLPGNIYASYLIDTLANDLPGQCSRESPMPLDTVSGEWLPLPPCSLQVVEQWVATGAAK